MSIKKIDQVKGDKGFKIWDILVYGIIAALLVSVFLAVFLTRNTDPFYGFEIKIGSDVVYAYDFEAGERTKIDTRYVEEQVEGDKIILTVSKIGTNIVEVDLKKRSVKVTEADCSRWSKDCVRTRALTDNNGMIACMPNNVFIVPFGDNPDVII